MLCRPWLGNDENRDMLWGLGMAAGEKYKSKSKEKRRKTGNKNGGKLH